MNQQELFTVEESKNGNYEGKNPLPPFIKGSKFAYGGALAAQCLASAYQSIDSAMEPHSLHMQFLSATPSDKTIKYRVKITQKTKSYVRVIIEAFYDQETLVGIAIISFTYRNCHHKRQIEWAVNPNPKQVPYAFQFTPLPIFSKYKQEDISKFPNVIDFLGGSYQLAMVPEEDYINNDPKYQAGDRRSCYYMKFNEFKNDKINQILAKDENLKRAYNYIDLAFMSDTSGFLRIFAHLNLGPLLRHSTYRIISLDHTVWFHDSDFDLQEWIFCDFSIKIYRNERALISNTFFNSKGKPFLTLAQEASLRMDQALADKASGGSYKL